MSDYNTLQARADGLSNEAVNMNANAGTIQAKLREAVALRFQNSPMIAARDTALKGVLDEPSQSRDYVAGLVKGGAILSPTQQDAISSGRKSNAIVPLVSANDLLARENGSITDIANAGTAAYKASAETATARAKLAQEQADSAFERFIKTSELDLKKGAAGAGGLDFSKLLQLANFGEPTAIQKTNADTATSGLNAIQAYRETLKKNPNALASSKNMITRLLGGTDAQTIFNKGTEIADILGRFRTGAALTKSEEELYGKSIPQIGDTPQTIENKLTQLENLYARVQARGVNKYKAPLDSFLEQNDIGGIGGGDWEVVQ